MLTSYHNHTTWSDGKVTVREHLEAASRLGLDEIGISDHFVLVPDNRPIAWSMPVDRLPDYLNELRREQENSNGVALRLGLEADFLPETAGKLKNILESTGLDYVIGSVHYVGEFSVDSFADDWINLSPDRVNDIWETYWIRVRQMAESRIFDVAAHLDLPKKFGFRPTKDFSREIAEALDAIAASGMAIEINTAGWHLPAKEAYPAFSILFDAHRRNIPLQVNADAHHFDNLTRDLLRGRMLAFEAGYRKLVRFEKRQPIHFPL